MPHKRFVIDDLSVDVHKRRANRSIRLTVTGSGGARVSIPYWTPYEAGLTFARSKLSWIRQQIPESQPLKSGQPIGKAHHLVFIQDSSVSKPRSTVKQNEITVIHPTSSDYWDDSVQAKAHTASLRALRLEAAILLPQRLSQLAHDHGLTYKSVTIRRLKSRWGSCDQNGNITLSLFLVQLPWDHIDYVLLHELMHTRIHQHGKIFWDAMAEICPDIKRLKNDTKNFRPVLFQ